ncbi:MAG: endonuclease/exonuclease/phosphatase family protein [Bryobacteraceae bacterium]
MLLRVLTFNIRLRKDEGRDAWENRRDLVVDVLRAKSPDVFGLQEAYLDQAQYIAAKLPQYDWFGESRRPKREDERVAIFYRRDVLRLIEHGDFWLSETPETPGSSSWKMNVPRIATWGLFELPSGGRFYYCNTHFSHREIEEQEARVESATLICRKLLELPAVPAIVTGDFNAPAGDEVYRVFRDMLEDAWESAASRTGPAETFHGFNGKEEDKRRIDWILYRGPWRVLEAETITYHVDDRYPSDHFPVFAVFQV